MRSIQWNPILQLKGLQASYPPQGLADIVPGHYGVLEVVPIRHVLVANGFVATGRRFDRQGPADFLVCRSVEPILLLGVVVMMAHGGVFVVMGWWCLFGLLWVGGGEGWLLVG